MFIIAHGFFFQFTKIFKPQAIKAILILKTST